MRRLQLGFVALAVAALVVLPGPSAGAFTTHDSFDANNFPNPTEISNEMLPLVPGMQFTLEGEVVGPDGTTPHQVVLTVSDVGKVINGVRTLVIWDRDFSNGEMEEEELAFFAQDNLGNVWNLGEYPEEYEDGRFVGAPSTWIAGVGEAKAGILMQAQPEEGTPEYVQGYAPDIEFEDKAKVSKVGQETCVPAGCYKNVLVVDEWNPLEQPEDGHQLKYHAPGVGNVRIEAVGGEEQETLVLVKAEQLDAQGMAHARAQVLKLDQRAYKWSKMKYQSTPPAEKL